MFEKARTSRSKRARRKAKLDALRRKDPAKYERIMAERRERKAANKKMNQARARAGAKAKATRRVAVQVAVTKTVAPRRSQLFSGPTATFANNSFKRARQPGAAPDAEAGDMALQPWR